MKQTKLRILIVIVFAALAVMLAGCKGESSPTAPSNTTTVPPTTTNPATPPPSGASISLTVSNPNPLVSSSSVITATVTQSSSPVPNGTAVQFVTNLGTFSDTGTTSTIRTTTGGVATATLSSPVAGTATITATVNNVQKSTSVTFSAQPVTPPPPNTAPTITGVSPNTGLPTGGQTIVIAGTNFRTPVRVLFDPGNGQAPKEGFVQSVTPTAITVVTPAFDISTGATLPVTITVIDEAGTANEQKVSLASGFTFAAAVLTPSITTVSPTSGPIDGGTNVAIIGDAFQAPVQVFFGSQEAHVTRVTFHEIDVISPTASATTPGGSGAVTGPVDIKVLNVNSNKSATLAAAFRYTPKMQITTAGPTQGPFTGGTRITIDGVGFNAPLSVVVAGAAAQVISVSGSEVIAITSPIVPTSCADTPGPIVVENTDNGDNANGPVFTYKILKPTILSATGSTIGGSGTIVVANAIGTPRITIGGSAASISSAVTDPNTGVTTFTVTIPPTLQLATQACAGGGTMQIPTAFDVVFTSATTGCSDTLTKGLTISPPNVPILTIVGNFSIFTGTITPGNPAATPPVPPTVTQPPSQTVTLVNTGPAPLIVTSITNNCNSSDFQVLTSPTPPVTLSSCDTLAIVASYTAKTAPSTSQCTVTITTNAGTKTLTLTGVSK